MNFKYPKSDFLLSLLILTGSKEFLAKPDFEPTLLNSTDKLSPSQLQGFWHF